MWALESRILIAFETDYYDTTSRSFRVRDFMSFCDAVLTVSLSQQQQQQQHQQQKPQQSQLPQLPKTETSMDIDG